MRDGVLRFAGSLLCALLLVSWLQPAVLAAQDLAAAETARRRGDHPRARRIAQEALEQGSSEPEQVAALLRIVGLSAAAEGDDDAARQAFTRLLAITPDVRLDADLPAEVRSPYLEARGFWTGTTDRLGIEVTLDEASETVVARAIDPAQMGSRYRLRVRLGEDGTWREVARAPSEEIRIEVPGLRETRFVQYSVAMLDDLGNRVYRSGSDDEPERAELPPPEVAGGSAIGGGVGGGTVVVERADPTPFYVIGGVLAAFAVGGLIGGGVLHAERESLAGQWNDDARCLVAGAGTRAQQCSGVDASRASAETGAAVLYGVGGAIAIAAIVTFAIAPSGGSEPSDEPPAEEGMDGEDVPPVTRGPRFGCTSGPGEIGLSCGATF